MGANIVIVAVFRAAGLLDGFFHRPQDDFTIDVLFARYGVSYLYQFHCRFLLAPYLVDFRSSSVSISLALLMAAKGRVTAPSSVSIFISPLSVPFRRPLKRLRPSSGGSISIFASKPLKSAKSCRFTSGLSMPG